KHEREILFARSIIYSNTDEKTQKGQHAWNAKVESEDEYTQILLLTWVRYDQYIQQTMQISTMWNHQIDFNLIYIALQGNNIDIDKRIKILFEFEQWKFQNSNKQKYKKKMDEFIKRRCCNHNINLFCMFIFKKCKNKMAIDLAASETVSNGLPFVEKDKPQK
ncbi:hypothetical protein RFI_37314, partial [Reticulomyxa filosa]